MMKTIVMWLFGVPVAVSLLFVVFAVDAEKLSPRIELPAVSSKLVIAPEGTTIVAGPQQSSRR
jgi:hypothetical protein